MLFYDAGELSKPVFKKPQRRPKKAAVTDRTKRPRLTKPAAASWPSGTELSFKGVKYAVDKVKKDKKERKEEVNDRVVLSAVHVA